ncbi:energy transducer TonB [Aureisphaera galaxeae]|uniref:energy transducer TonB n=1 Tax=Aureisphaera galaxeae TaxID=1538023 RepID=UPI002350A287|nr:energy transducer TonB [Aureisphaera galaxeae]MDC8002709.1 energy transducer TonB [Aureisphaera galaxeae]
MELKKNPEASLHRWSTVFFLLGLVFILFITWRSVELKTFNHQEEAQAVQIVSDDLESDIPVTQQVIPPPPPPPPMAALPQVINVVEDTEEVEESVFESTETDQTQEIVEIETIEEFEEEEEIVDIPFAVIEHVPIYPGCEGLSDNAAQKKCMADRIMQFVQVNFNTELANDLGLEGQQRINVMFKIDHKGDVVNVRARAPHPKLEEEAIKVVRSLPKMTPGKQRGRPVGVLYALPILFKVEVG